MDNASHTSLQWLAQQHFEEQRSLRSAEDNLFNWATSLFFAGLGALTTLKGFSGGNWTLIWRLLLMIGVLGFDGTILMMAYLMRRSYQRNQRELASIIVQITPVNLSKSGAGLDEGQLFFYLRWSAVGGLGFITLCLIWMLG
ncbi:MAG: hypothetical protein ABI947_05815 [Chloroflexota bacterium]